MFLRSWQFLLVAALAAFISSSLFAADTERGTVIREAQLYVTPDPTAQKVGTVTRGRDIYFVMGRSNIDGKEWAHVVARVEAGLMSAKDISGWIDNKLLITPNTPNGDQIIYGEAADSENQAEQRGGRKHAAEDAMRLYYRLSEYFPNSPLAGEALWRAADIRWQLEKEGILIRPSARELSPDMRTQIDDETMKQVLKKFPHTKWADLAAYDMLDNKLCFDWKGEAHCPEKESDIYEHYAHEHPQSPKAPEALYNAAWRQAALVDIYKSNRENDKAEHARKKGLALAQELQAQHPDGDWKARATNLSYALEQSLTVYGSGAANAQ
ncbi:MAG TPA: hypothetical protein VKW06_14650 [Candidatus Angelobacter sp.]|nr:hypothetical protein [Candidatus Angelobacter sp.]